MRSTCSALDAASLLDDLLPRLGVGHGVAGLAVDEASVHAGGDGRSLEAHRHRGPEGAQQVGVLGEPEGAQEDGGRHLALAVDLHPEQVLVVEVELHPGAAVGNDLGGEGASAFRWKKAPGLRWSWLTITRSVPFTMKVPLSVSMGISPK
jgi:hypothetical protein